MYNDRGRQAFSGRRSNSSQGGFRNFSNSGYKKPGYQAIRKPRFAGKYIDPALFVKKAEDFIETACTETVNNFTDFGLEPGLLANVMAKGYIKPTPIQDQAIGHILNNKDVLGVANTGTGKTAAFAIPLINKILANPNKRIIILAPTRELAVQIKQEIRTFTPGLKVYIALAIGGAYLREQIVDIRRGPHIIIGTPGRIKDLGQRRVINFSRLDTLVLDEVDRMLDMGFIDDIKSIVDQIPPERQTLFFSATVDKKVEGLINTFLRDPVKVSVKTADSSSHVEQNIVRVNRNDKERMLCSLLAKPDFKKVLIFGGTKRIVDKITITLTEKGFSAGSIHGDKPQHKRQSIMRSFKEDQISILVATDVAARGLDIADITHVINFDKPMNYDDYIHRIGRTGRGDAKGYALTFVD